MVLSIERVRVHEVSSGVRARGAPIERIREEDPVAEIAISKARRRDSEKKLMQSMDAEQAAHERQGCRGEYEPPEQWHGAGSQKCEWRFQSRSHRRKWNVGENDKWFQKSELGCLERMSCDAR